MRNLILLLVLGASAAPAAAQVPASPILRNQLLAQDAQQTADQRAQRNRDIAVTNDQSVRQAAAQTDRALNNTAVSRVTSPAPVIPSNPAAPLPKLDAGQFAQIPDAALAASNARAVAAANNRR